MTQIPTPPASRLGSEAPETKVKSAASVDLAQCLDTLLEQYLHLLDEQQKLQSGLAERLSSGFIALAQANFSSPPGRRYGPDYYDERMKATRNISIQSEERVEELTTDLQETEHITAFAGSGYTFSTLHTPSHKPEEVDGNNTTKTSGQVQSVPPGGLEETTETTETTETPPAEAPSSENPESSRIKIAPLKEPKPRSKSSRSADPIHWYGILVPPSLRRAQDSFAHAIDNQVPDLASTTSRMRALEQRISQLRLQLETESSGATSP
ncbi:hypothetical protein N7457_006118 [Penicillium paradoxum]|uniref:uncharacterized protein n=1 Tax=Penicillium paradoxum TaxID=176176 RepID=UPI002546D78B|nr:uncharacterized protein N7457_006118 [Penicillium paradoxum]KAJ5780958.1 hypothetical protein N7457_006118 [Penicillium paradoxum]